MLEKQSSAPIERLTYRPSYCTVAFYANIHIPFVRCAWQRDINIQLVLMGAMEEKITNKEKPSDVRITLK